MPPAIVDDMDGKPEWVKRRVVDISSEEIDVTRQQYCAATELIDDQIGEMLRALEQRGMLDNTYIIYSSDHGEMLGDHGALHEKCRVRSIPQSSPSRCWTRYCGKPNF